MATKPHILHVACMVLALSGLGAAQDAGAAPTDAVPVHFIEVAPGKGVAPVWLATSQVVRIGRVGDYTVIDTTAWVQQRTIEPVEAVARRLTAAGQQLIALTDLDGRRIYLTADRIVLVRDAQDRYAAGARASIVMVGLRFNTDIAVRESVKEVMTALHHEGAQRPTASPALGVTP